MGVVSFDLDDTLWEFAPMMDGAIAAAIVSLERRAPELAGRLDVAALHEHRRLTGEEAEGTLEELRRLSFRRALTELGRDDAELADWMADELLSARAEVVELHADVLPAVERLLADGHTVGAITNGNFPFAELSVARRFAFVVHAEQIGEMKPAAAPFRHAIELCGGDPARWVHVGDGLDTDIAGAQAVGMKAVWINRAGIPLPEGYSPDAELPSLAGLDALVTELLGD